MSDKLEQTQLVGSPPSGLEKTNRFCITWKLDEFPDVSYLEQWDTPLRYYDCRSPECPVCTEEMTYESKHTFSCPNGCASITLLYDGPQSGVVVHEDGTRVPFEEYKDYWGNPAKHQVLECIIKRRCGDCGSWTPTASISGVDFMYDDRVFLGTFDEDEMDPQLNEYQLELTRELLEESRAR